MQIVCPCSERSEAINLQATSGPSVEALIGETMKRLQIPGVAVGIVHEGQEYRLGFGVTSVDHPLPVTADTLFQVGSITKTVVGTAALRLAELGQLDLEAPIRTYLPDMRLPTEELTTSTMLDLRD